jgi:hypothetical protein
MENDPSADKYRERALTLRQMAVACRGNFSMQRRLIRAARDYERLASALERGILNDKV